MLFQWIDSLFEWGILIVTKWFGRLRFVIQQVLTIVIFCLIVLWASMFLYGCFYYTYMPTVTHERDLHLHFRTDCPDFGDGFYCSFPQANVTLVKDNQAELLMRGQSYVVSVDIEMPESPVNQNHGMLMTLLQFYARHGEVVRTSSRSVMLRYKSFLYQVIETFFYLPSLLLSTSEQKQNIKVEFFTNYHEDPYKPAVGVFFQVQSRRIEVYKASLKIHATFYGLRYLLFHWPTISAIVGVSINAFFISMILLIAWCNLGNQLSNGNRVEQMKRLKIREDLIREKSSRSAHSLPVSYHSSSSRPSKRSALQKPAENIQALSSSTSTNDVTQSSSMPIVSSIITSQADTSVDNEPPDRTTTLLSSDTTSPQKYSGTDTGELRLRNNTQSAS